MVKEKIENPWQCNFCMKKFPKDSDGKWKKLQDLQFCMYATRNSIFKHKDNPEHLIHGSKWLKHLYFRTDNPLDPMSGVCPKSLCLHCFIKDGNLLQFQNYGQYTYHKKKCPYKNDSLKSLMMTSNLYLQAKNDLEDEELAQEERLIKKQKAQEEYFKKQKEIREEELRREEDFISRAKFYDAPPPRSQASIDREKKYKKCAKEIAIEVAMEI
jgi:hypothetical protein